MSCTPPVVDPPRANACERRRVATTMHARPRPAPALDTPRFRSATHLQHHRSATSAHVAPTRHRRPPSATNARPAGASTILTRARSLTPRQGVSIPRLHLVVEPSPAGLAPPLPRHEQQPRDHRVELAALQGDLVGLHAAAATSRLVTGGAASRDAPRAALRGAATSPARRPGWSLPHPRHPGNLNGGGRGRVQRAG